MPATTNHYLTLKLNANGRNAQELPYTENEIKRAFRAAALAAHPDKNTSEFATEQFDAVNIANSVLSNAQKRAEFDAGLARNFEAYRSTSHLILLDDESKPIPFESKNEPLAVVLYQPQGIDITALINNSNTGIKQILEMAENNINFMQALLENNAIWLQFSQLDQFKLLFSAFTLTLTNKNLNIADKAFIRVLVDNITNERNYQEAFVKYCEENKFIANQLLNSNLFVLTAFSRNALMQLGANFYSAIYALFQTYLPSLKMWQLHKFVTQYPEFATDLVTMIENDSTINRKFTAFSKVRAGKDSVAALRQLNPEMKLLGLETLDVTYGLGRIGEINFKMLAFNYVMNNAIDFPRLSPESLKGLSIEYVGWLYRSMKSVKLADNGAESLKGKYILTPRHVQLLNLMTAEDFKNIIEELDLDLFPGASRDSFLDFMFNYKSQQIIENEENDEKDESDAYSDLLKMLVGAKKDEIWEFLNKHKLLAEITKRGDYLAILIEKDARSLAYHLAKNKEAMSDTILNAQSENFQSLYKAFCTLLKIVQPIMDQIKQRGSANLNAPQETIRYQTFDALTKLTGYFLELCFFVQDDYRINQEIIHLAFTNTEEQNRSFNISGLRLIFLKAMLGATSQEASLLLDKLKDSISSKVVKLALTFEMDDTNLLPKIVVLQKILANTEWATKYLNAGLLLQYHVATRNCMVVERRQIDENIIVRKKLHSLQKLKSKLEMIKATGVYMPEDLEEMVELIEITRFDAEIYELISQNLERTILLRDALFRCILMNSEIEISIDFKTRIFNLKPKEITDIAMLVKFKKFAQNYLAQVKRNIDPEILSSLVEKHGIDILNSYPALRAQLKQTDKLKTIMQKLQDTKATFESRMVYENEEVKLAHEEFRSFIECNAELTLADNSKAAEIFDHLTFIKDKHDHPLTKKYLDAFPKEDPKDILLWTINCAVEKESFAVAKINKLFATHASDIAIIAEKLLKAFAAKGLGIPAVETILSDESFNTLSKHSLLKLQKDLVVEHLILQFDQSKQNLQMLEKLGETKNHFLAFYFNWSSKSLELNYFNALACNDMEKYAAAIKFFSSVEFRTLRVELLDFIESLDASTISDFPTTLVESTLKIDFSNAEQVAEYLVNTRALLTSFCIKHNATNPVVKNILNNFEGNNFDVSQLLMLYGSLDTNNILSYHLKNVNACFEWPTNPDQVKSNLICQLVLAGKLQIPQLAGLTKNELSKFDHRHVNKYLTHLLEVKKDIQIEKLFLLKANRLNVFPLFESNLISIDTANYFPSEQESTEGKILTRYLAKTDWNNQFAMARLQFIMAFLQSDHFADIEEKIIQPLFAKESSLIKENTLSGEIKARQIRTVNQAIIPLITTHLDKMYAACGEESGIIGKKLFSHNLNVDLIKTITHYANSETICNHRNLISKFLKLVLNGLTWFIKPLLSDATRNRLFSPSSAKSLHGMVDRLTTENSTTYKIA